MSRLDCWQFVAVSQGSFFLRGFIYEDPRFKDGTYVHTSLVMEVIKGEDGNPVSAITRSGTHYRLEKKAEDCLNEI